MEKAGRDVGEGNEEKKKRGRESLSMNHSWRYRTIWTGSPACSEHVYLRFRVSTSRHCTRFPSLSLSLPFLASSSMHRYRGSAAPLSGALNGTFVNPSRCVGNGMTTVDPPVWTPHVVHLARKGESGEWDWNDGWRGEQKEKRRDGEGRKREEEPIPSLEPRGGGWHPGASQRGAVSSSLGSPEQENLVRERLPSSLLIFFVLVVFFCLCDRCFSSVLSLLTCHPLLVPHHR